MVTLLETLPKSYTFTVPEVPTEPGLWELSIYAFDGTNTSYEYYFPYYIVNELSGQDDETEPKLVEHPNDGVMKVNQDVKISFEDDTDIYYIAYKWVTEKEESYVKNATMVYHPKNGEITIKAPDIKGRYYLQWFAVDGSRVISTGYFVIIDVRNDVEPPEIKLNGEDPQYIDISEGTYNDPGATAHDIYDNRDVEVTIDTSAVQDALNKKQTGEAKVKFTAKDSENNESTTERTVYVVDYSALKDLVEEIGKLNQADYTEKSWKDFQDKLSKANQMIQNKKSKQEEIEAMEAELEAAKDALSLQTPTIKNVTIVANKDPYKTEGKYYLKSGESITVTFETDTPIDLSQKFTINEIEKNITLTKIGNDNEYKYTFDYTLGENDKEGIISYIIKLTKTMAGKNETEAEISGSKQEIIFDKTAPELQFVDGINQSLTIFVGDNPAIAESDVKDKNQEVIDVEINRNGFDNTKPNTYTITYESKRQSRK